MLCLMAKYSIYRALKNINYRLCQAVSLSFLFYPMPLYQGRNFTAAIAIIAPHFGLDVPWKKKLLYGHNGLCAPGSVQVPCKKHQCGGVGLPWITATQVHSVLCSRIELKWVCSSRRWSLIITSMISREVNKLHVGLYWLSSLSLFACSLSVSLPLLLSGTLSFFVCFFFFLSFRKTHLCRRY